MEEAYSSGMAGWPSLQILFQSLREISLAGVSSSQMGEKMTRGSPLLFLGLQGLAAVTLLFCGRCFAEDLVRTVGMTVDCLEQPILKLPRTELGGRPLFIYH